MWMEAGTLLYWSFQMSSPWNTACPSSWLAIVSGINSFKHNFLWLFLKDNLVWFWEAQKKPHSASGAFLTHIQLPSFIRILNKDFIFNSVFPNRHMLLDDLKNKNDWLTWLRNHAVQHQNTCSKERETNIINRRYLWNGGLDKKYIICIQNVVNKWTILWQSSSKYGPWSGQGSITWEPSGNANSQALPLTSWFRNSEDGPSDEPEQDFQVPLVQNHSFMRIKVFRQV